MLTFSENYSDFLKMSTVPFTLPQTQSLTLNTNSTTKAIWVWVLFVVAFILLILFGVLYYTKRPSFTGKSLVASRTINNLNTNQIRS